MNALAEKINDLLPELEKRGTIYLLALLQRTDVNLWDVMVSSEWSDTDYAGATRIIADVLTTQLEPQVLAMLSRIVVVPSTDPSVLQTIRWGPSDFKQMPESDFMGVSVGRVYFLKSQLPPETRLIETSAAGAGGV